MLVEVLPALVLLSVVLAAGLRLQLAASRLAQLAAERVSEEEAFAWALVAWRTSSGLLVIVEPDASGRWTVRDLPDAGWLPEAVPASGAYWFRRQRVDSIAAGARWFVEAKGRSGQWIGWCEFAAVMEEFP